MRILWRDDHPGLFISDIRLNEDGENNGSLNMPQWSAFRSAAVSCLERIHSRPVGRDLLGLISKRHQGIGAKPAGNICRIFMGLGTVGNDAAPGAGADRQVWRRHWADMSTEYLQSAVDMTSAPTEGGFRAGRLGMAFAGNGLSARAVFNPLISYDAVMFARVGVPTPAFVALAHELIHCLHTMSGDCVKDDDDDRERMIEEARTVGLGRWRDSRISENAIRAEHGIARRSFYLRPGDCARL